MKSKIQNSAYYSLCFLRVAMLSKCVVYIYPYVHVGNTGWREAIGETGCFEEGSWGSGAGQDKVFVGCNI